MDYLVDVKPMDALTTSALYDLLRQRVDVFVVEQKCPYAELDGKDADALHLRLLADDQLIASARLAKPPSSDQPATIQRVLVAPSQRGKRLGVALMREAIAQCETHFPGHDIGLSAQSHLQRFYASFGFQPTSAEYVEDGIPHIDMVRYKGTETAGSEKECP